MQMRLALKLYRRLQSERQVVCPTTVGNLRRLVDRFQVDGPMFLPDFSVCEMFFAAYELEYRFLETQFGGDLLAIAKEVIARETAAQKSDYY